MQIPEGIHRLSLFVGKRPLNLYLVWGEEPVLVDTGLAGQPTRFVFREMHRLGLDPARISMAVNTHAHADHMGGNAEILSVTRCRARIVAHERDVPWVEDHELLSREAYEAFSDVADFGPESRSSHLVGCGPSTTVTNPVKGGEMLDVRRDCRLKLLHLPGHTMGNIGLYDEDRAILFEGETILGSYAWEDSRLVGVPYYADVDAYRETLRRLQGLEVECLLSAHAEPREGEQIGTFLGESLAFVDTFDELVMSGIDDLPGPVGLAEICRTVGGKLGMNPRDLGLVLLVHTHIQHHTKVGDLTPILEGRRTAYDHA